MVNEFTVLQVLQECGAPANLSGFLMAARAIQLQAEKVMPICRLYERLAGEYELTACQVERRLRDVVEECFKRGDPDVLRKYFGSSVRADKGKATNQEFVNALAIHVKLKCAAQRGNMKSVFL